MCPACTLTSFLRYRMYYLVWSGYKLRQFFLIYLNLFEATILDSTDFSFPRLCPVLCWPLIFFFYFELDPIPNVGRLAQP